MRLCLKTVKDVADAEDFQTRAAPIAKARSFVDRHSSGNSRMVMWLYEDVCDHVHRQPYPDII